ncbi:hypothetical protein BH10PSE1_BH10PSE1_14250 [soil metagenome]
MRRLWLWFALAFAVTLFGFWPTTVGRFGPPDTLRIIHGAFAVTWMAMLMIQSWLIGHGHRRIHRWVGRASLIVVPGLLISAVMVVLDSLPTGGAAHFPQRLLIILCWIDLWSLSLFAALYVAALIWRRNMFVHSRLMASTVFVAIIPALGRAYGMNIPALHGLTGALNPSFWTCEIILVGLILRDGLNGRWKTPWWITLIGLEAIRLTMIPAADWSGFVAILRMLGLPAAT